MKSILSGALLTAALLAASGAQAGEARAFAFGKLADGREVQGVVLSNAHGVSASVIAYGASLQSVVLPDRNGVKADVALGYADMRGYLEAPNYFGATVGRLANRVARARFTLDGTEHRLAANNGPNALHGGLKGFDKQLWEVVEVAGGAAPHVVLRLVSPDGDEGYPGVLTVTATYALNDQNELSIDYRATTDRPTVVNLSNHAYWNLAGEGSALGAMGHTLEIPAQTFTPVDETLIPTGELKSVAGTVFDFRAPQSVGKRVRDGDDQQIVFGRGYDHNWVVTAAVTAKPHLMARVQEPVSGRGFELWSNQPGLQFYSGNFLDGTVRGKSGKIYRQGDAIVLEPQQFPDAVNQPKFGSVRLEPGQTYVNQILYRFTGGQAAAKP